MKYGSPLAAGLGEPGLAVSYINLVPVTHGVLLRFMARPGWGNAYFGVFNNGILVANVFAPEGYEPRPLRISANYFANQISITVLRLGHFGDPGYDLARVARTYEALDSRRVTLFWTWKPKLIGPESDGGYTSAWSLNGLSRLNTTGVGGKPTWAQLAFDLNVSAGNATLTLRQGQNSLASGTAAVGNTVALAPQNNSGVSGSAFVAGGAASIGNAVLYLRWPAAMNIRRDVVNPPVATVATTLFDGADSATWTEPADLSSGTYYYNLAEVSDTGTEGTQSAPAFTTVIASPPDPPTQLTYISGNAASGVTLGFTPSATAGATYRLYLGQAGGQMDLNIVSATAAAGTAQIVTPALTGAPGTARVLLRAVSGGIEEKNLAGFDIPLDSSGNYVAPAPNVPSILTSSISITNGLTLSIRGTYATMNEPGAATELKLYSRTPTGSYGAAIATAALVPTSTGIKSASFTYTFGGGGLRYIALKAATAGGVLSPFSDEVEINPDTSLMPPPDNASAYVSRG